MPDHVDCVLPPMPRVTADLPGVGGRIREHPADFEVTELPAYEPSGEGTHAYLWVEKVGIPTMELVHRLAAALGRKAQEFGVAGLKDARAKTRQWISIEHVDPAKLENLKGDGWRVLKVSHHKNKLKIGHLRGNSFRILIRGTGADGEGRARAIMDRLTTGGVPNIFGHQRFGLRGDTHLMGAAILNGEWKRLCDLLLGHPRQSDPPAAWKFRSLYDAGEYHDARRNLPHGHREHAAVLDALLRSKGDFSRAGQTLPRQMKRFFVSAWQSALFNEVVAQRLPNLGLLLPGDLAWLHDRGAVFRVEDLAVDQPRADRLEISPTGPLFGFRMTEPTGRPGEIEKAVLAASGVGSGAFRGGGKDNLKGCRRPLRVPLESPALEAVSEDLWISFSLPSGCYATVVLDELMKSGAAEAEPDAGVDEEIEE